jgi:hypothetical protein
MVRVIARGALRHRMAALAMGAMLVPAAVFSVAVAPAAQAATCTYRVHESSVQDSQSPTVRVRYDFAPECSDGLARMSGVVYDTACDGRAAQIQYWIYDKTSSGTWRQIDYGFADTDNGCGTSSSFSHVRNSPGSAGWRLKVQIKACNTVSCSDGGSPLYYYG